MIERLLAADAALERGDLDKAEGLFSQIAAADARNAIAVTGLAQVARRRGDLDAARAHAARALTIDPEDAAAMRLVDALSAPALSAPAPEAPAPEAPATTMNTTAAQPPPASGDAWRTPGVEAAPPVRAAVRPSLLRRLRRWLGLSSRNG